MASLGKIGMTNVARFFDTSDPERTSRYTISGVTRDSNNVALGNCNVNVFETMSGLLRGETVSDENGNYNVEIAGDRTIQFYAVAYKVGSPDVLGTTINTLLAT